MRGCRCPVVYLGCLPVIYQIDRMKLLVGLEIQKSPSQLLRPAKSFFEGNSTQRCTKVPYIDKGFAGFNREAANFQTHVVEAKK